LRIKKFFFTAMRHGKKFNHLGRKKAHREAMLRNMACSLIEHKRIKTTVAKAKAFRTFVEPLITKSKTDVMHSRRTVFSRLHIRMLYLSCSEKLLRRSETEMVVIQGSLRLEIVLVITQKCVISSWLILMS